MKSNCQPNTTTPAKPCPEVPHLLAMRKFVRSYPRQHFINHQLCPSFSVELVPPSPVLVVSARYVKGEEEQCCVLPEVPSLEGETTEHVGWMALRLPEKLTSSS